MLVMKNIFVYSIIITDFKNYLKHTIIAVLDESVYLLIC